MKLDTDVSFPIEFLDMSDFVLHDVRDTRQSCMGSNVYDLAAVIVHHGSGYVELENLFLRFTILFSTLLI